MVQNQWSPLRVVLVIVLTAILAVGFFVGRSVFRVHNCIGQSLEAYVEYENCLDKSDIVGAITALEKLSLNVGKIEDEANSWPWQLLSSVPVMGEDIACVRSTATIADTLANDALLPVLRNAQDIMADVQAFDTSSVDWSDLDAIGELFSEKGEQIMALAAALSDARPYVRECSDAAKEIPTSHFKELNELADNVRGICDQTEEVYEQFDSLFSLVDILT